MKWTAAVPGVLVVALIAGASLIDMPAPASGEPPAATTIAVDPTDQPAVCPGPLVVPVGDIDSGDDALDSTSDDRDLWMSPSASAPVGDGSAVETTVATSLERVGGGDIASLAGVTCAPPRQDQWIVAGSTALGASSRLVVANPSDATVRITVTLYGPLSLDGKEAFTTVIGPQSQESVLIESIESELPTVAMRIQAGGVGVTAALQDSRLDGFTAAGTDWVTASAMATDLTVPVPAASSTENPAVLRLISPDDAEATLAMVDGDGHREWLDGETLSLEAGLITDVTIPQGAAGAVQITSDVPVTASTMVRTSYDIEDSELTAGDLAWTPAQLSGDTTARAVVVPPGDVTVVASSASSTTLELVDEGGEVVASERVPSWTAVTFPLEVEPGTQISSDSEATWVVLVTDGGFITTLTPRALERLPQEVSLEAGPYAPGS